MIKRLVVWLVLAGMLGVAGPAFAKVTPLVYVPAGHWAYASVAKLAQGGIITGYGEGTFGSGQLLTRYEMAIMVAKAMVNEEKATTEQIIEIVKLKTEFRDELAKMGIKADYPADKADKIKFSGEVRTRYEWSQDSALTPGNKSPQSWTRLRLGMKAQLTDELAFNGKFETESQFGDNSSDNTAHLTQANIFGKALGFNFFLLGRQPLYLGQGLLADNDGPADGLVVGTIDKKWQTVAGSLKAAGYLFTVANVGCNVNKDLKVSASYAKDKDGVYYKDWAAGFNYAGIKNIGLTYEYGANGADRVKEANNGSTAKAWFAKVKYLGADGAKVKSYGWWVAYRKADKLFDYFGFTTFANDQARASNVSLHNDPQRGALNGALNDVKGFQYGFEYTVFDNAIIKLMYNQLKDNATGNNGASNYICQLTYSF